jgi:hypothetical protein
MSNQTEQPGDVERARDILSNLSSYLGAGMGDDATTLEEFDKRIRWGIDHVGRVYRDRAAQVVEECSKRPRTTWGEVKRAILDDTCLPTAALSAIPRDPRGLVEALRRSTEGWQNAVELGLIPERHRNTAQILADEGRNALAAWEAGK